MSEDIKRYCRACQYPLDLLDHNACPECGKAFDPDDHKTTDDSPNAKSKRRLTACVVGFYASLTAYIVLFTLQWFLISVWHLANQVFWFLPAGRHGSWWELVGPGLWLYSIQLGIFLIWSVVFGVIVGKRWMKN